MFNRNVHRTPKQKAEKAVMNIIARLAGCGFLVYFVVKLINTPAEDRPDASTVTIITTILIVLAVFVIGITVLDFLRALKTGRFKTSTYDDEDLAEYLKNREEDAETCACEDEQKELASATDDNAESATEETDDKEP